MKEGFIVDNNSCKKKKQTGLWEQVARALHKHVNECKVPHIVKQ